MIIALVGNILPAQAVCQEYTAACRNPADAENCTSGLLQDEAGQLLFSVRRNGKKQLVILPALQDPVEN